MANSGNFYPKEPLLKAVTIDLTRESRNPEKLCCPTILVQNIVNFGLTSIVDLYAIQKIEMLHNEVQAAVPLIVYCTAAFTSPSDSVSYITLLFLE